MKKPIWSGAFAALAFSSVIILSAQDQSPSQTPATPQAPPSATQQTPAPQPSQPATPEANSSEPKLTITGCLKPAAETAATAGASAASPTGTTGSAEAKPSAGNAEFKYMLENATSAEQAASASSSGRSYLLIANDSALAPHVGKKVELTGSIEGQGSSSSAGGADSRSNMPKLKVESGKVIAASCAN